MVVGVEKEWDGVCMRECEQVNDKSVSLSEWNNAKTVITCRNMRRELQIAKSDEEEEV